MSLYPKDPRDDFLTLRSIYALIDPRKDQNYIYIGMTTNCKRRYHEHKYGCGTLEKISWLLELREKDLVPSFIILEEENMYAFEAAQLESVWIRVVTRENVYHSVNYSFDQQRAWKTFNSLKEKAKKRRLPVKILDTMRQPKIYRLPQNLIQDYPLENIKPSIMRVRDENYGSIPDSYNDKNAKLKRLEEINLRLGQLNARISNISVRDLPNTDKILNEYKNLDSEFRMILKTLYRRR